MEFRKLASTDYVEYYRLINEFRPTTFTEQHFIEYIRTLPSNIEIWVGLLNCHIIVSGTILFEPKLIFNMVTVAHIEDICVLEEFRGKCVGTYMMDHIISICKARGCYKATLVCRETISDFYKKVGFSVRGVHCSILLTD